MELSEMLPARRADGGSEVDLPEIFPSPRWVGGNVPMVGDYSASALALDAQSPHRAHHRDLVPGIAAAWRLDAAVSQFLSNRAKSISSMSS